jgi:hypothetical protein
MEMSLQPSCFVEIFLEVASDEQRVSNMKEVEFIIIETSAYVDFYGIISVCADKKMQSDLFEVIIRSGDIQEKIRNNFLVQGFKYNLEHENPDLCQVILSQHQIILFDNADVCIEAII